MDVIKSYGSRLKIDASINFEYISSNTSESVLDCAMFVNEF